MSGIIINGKERLLKPISKPADLLIKWLTNTYRKKVSLENSQRSTLDLGRLTDLCSFSPLFSRSLES